MELIKTVKIGKRKWKLIEDFSCYYGGFIKVPKNFETNGASVPRIFWWFLDPATELFEAAVVHDYLLSINNVHAHFIFYKVALHYGVPKYKAKIAKWGVQSYFALNKLMKKVKLWK